MRSLVVAVIVVGCSSPAEERVDPPVDSGTEIDSAIAPDTAAATETAVDSATCGCASYSDPITAGTIAFDPLNEISGLAVSRAHPGVIWTHNDSGDTPRMFAIGGAGAFLGEVTIKNMKTGEQMLVPQAGAGDRLLALLAGADDRTSPLDPRTSDTE